MTYYTYNPLMQALTAAPNYIRTAGGRIIVNPTAAQYAEFRKAYPRGEDAPQPEPPKGKVVFYAGYTLGEDSKWHRGWKLVDAPPPTVKAYDATMEAYLRAERSARGYTTREPDAYLESSNVRWAQDARDWVAHRDAVMSYALDVMNAVKAGLREPPTMEEFRAGFPKVVWTAEVCG